MTILGNTLFFGQFCINYDIIKAFIEMDTKQKTSLLIPVIE